MAATDFIQVLETSDVPAGVVNILTGSHVDLASQMAAHMDIDSVWSFGDQMLSEPIEKASASNLKRTWLNNGLARDWIGRAGQGKEFLDASTEIKNIWVPYGE